MAGQYCKDCRHFDLVMLAPHIGECRMGHSSRVDAFKPNFKMGLEGGSCEDFEEKEDSV